MTDILLLDDDPFQLKILTRQLASAGYPQVIGCTAADEALQVLDDPARDVGLLFLDLNMPGVDGVAFLRLLAGHHASTAVVLVSGEDERLVETAVRIGESHQLRVLGALQKPVLSGDLRDILARWEADVTESREEPVPYAAEAIARAVSQGELANYYAPIVDLGTGAVAGVEALVRWRHPRDGLVLPGRFIATAESEGLIHDLSRVVLRAALGHARAWRAMGLELRVAVNVSMQDLNRLDFFDLLLSEAAANGVPPSALSLEITEAALADGTRAAMETVSRLRLKRVTMSIDDFGTSRSSLAQLRDLAFNEIKIDGSFVHGASANPSLAVVLESGVKLARQLGMTTVAEGVDDRSDWDWVRDHGCDLAQGYFIGRPMPADDLPLWLGSWDRRKPELLRR